MSGISLVWCALYYVVTGPRCRHYCETSLKILIWVRLTRASRLFTRKDIAIQFPGVSLYGILMGFHGCVYFLTRSQWQHLDKVKAFASVCMSPFFKWLTCHHTARKSQIWFPSFLLSDILNCHLWLLPHSQTWQFDLRHLLCNTVGKNDWHGFTGQLPSWSLCL